MSYRGHFHAIANGVCLLKTGAAMRGFIRPASRLATRQLAAGKSHGIDLAPDTVFAIFGQADLPLGLGKSRVGGWEIAQAIRDTLPVFDSGIRG
jgi:hypothetical protein